MKRFLFLLAWAEGSDSAGGDATEVQSQQDLMPEFLKGNQHIFAVEIQVSTFEDDDDVSEIASKYGYAEAFYNNYTAHDSVSVTTELPANYKIIFPCKRVMVNL